MKGRVLMVRQLETVPLSLMVHLKIMVPFTPAVRAARGMASEGPSMRSGGSMSAVKGRTSTGRPAPVWREAVTAAVAPVGMAVPSGSSVSLAGSGVGGCFVRDYAAAG